MRKEKVAICYLIAVQISNQNAVMDYIVLTCYIHLDWISFYQSVYRSFVVLKTETFADRALDNDSANSKSPRQINRVPHEWFGWTPTTALCQPACLDALDS